MIEGSRHTPVQAPQSRGARWLAAVAYPLALFLGVLVLASLARALLTWGFFERVERTSGYSELFTVGLHIDAVTASFLALVPTVAWLLMPARRYRLLELPLVLYFSLVLTLMVTLEAVSFDFLEEYDQRPNRIFVEYLGGSKEVTGTLWAQYHWQLIATAVLAALTFVLSWKLATRVLALSASARPAVRRGLLALALPLLALGARGTLDHRPVNPSSAAFSGENLLNQLALNSTYSVAYAAYSMRSERSPADLYGHMAPAEIYERVGKYTTFAPDSAVAGDIPFLHVQRPQAPARRPKNLVLVLEESLGAEFVGCLGGLPLTPNFDELSREGLLLTNLFSTGTRTVRGIEATVCGFLPTPASAVVKLPRSQSGFFTLAALLRQHGYATDFIYGGESHFDNMAAFLLGNGFERAFSQEDFVAPAFHGTWGVSDEDLMRKANETFVAHGDRPFFALVLSVSNHSPFEFPEGRIELHDPEPYTRNNAMKYADYALGELFRLAKRERYWNDTLWIVVADHNTRVYGDDLIPVSKFHIPGLILGPGVSPGRFERVASQIDLAPTALHLLGLETTHPLIGRNLFELAPDDPGRAILQYYDAHGLLVGDRIAIHPGAAEPGCFRFAGGRLEPLEPDVELLRDARAHALLPGLLYEARSYRLPPHAGE